jgi:ribosomal protein S18 acetylase RimI-like enzyme
MKASEIEERVNSSTTWVWDNNGTLLGCAAVGQVRESAQGPVVSAWVYTAPDYRRQGIGAKLWEQVRAHISGMNVGTVHTVYRTDAGNSRQLFLKHGFEPWFSAHSMRYVGPDFDDITIEPIPYTDLMFEDYVRLTNEGFRWLRIQCNIDPADCYPVGFNEAEARKKALDEKDNIFFFFEDGKAIGYTQLSSDFIHTITVDESCQGRGLGRQITKLSVNLLRQRGAETVYLGVADVNHIARRLYESMGFERIETVEFARLFFCDPAAVL